MRAALSVVALLVGCGHDASEALHDAGPADPLSIARVAQFGFEGTLADESTGKQATCVAGKCPTFVAGKHGMAVQFDGAAQCLQFAVQGMAGPTFTVALWMNEASDGRYAIISKPFHATTTDNDSWQLETDTPRAFGFSTANAGRHDYMWLGSAVTPGVWQHVAITWDGSLKRIYVDGSLAESLADPDPVQWDATSPMIGCDYGGGALGYFYPGAIDDVVVYDRALSDAEIAQLSNLAQ
ncbi:MAG: LamG domain-containing protein [Acidobacteriota bacterium]